MKKIYFSITFLLVGLICFGQLAAPEMQISENRLDEQIAYYVPTTIPSSVNAAVLPIWEEDFSGGIPTTWINGSTPTLPVISAPWVYRGPSTTPGVGTGSQGAYAGSNGPIASPTASNGFMIFDSDFYDNNGVAGNFGFGTYPCNSSTGAPAGHVGTLTTDSIDCSMYSDLSILVNSFYREFSGQASIAFSIDGGLTFTDTLDANPGIGVNESTANDYQVMLRMPSNIAGNPNVKMQFIYDGTILLNGYNGYYFWMIDDIQIIETPDNYLAFSSETFGGWWIGYETTGDFGIDFTFNPMNQATASPYRYEGTIVNSGVKTQDNVTMHVLVDDSVLSNVNTPVSFTSAPLTSAPNQQDTVATTVNYTPTEYGVQFFKFWASSDSTITDTILRTTIVTDTVYGVDKDWNTDGARAGGGYFLGRWCGGQVLANAFDIYADATITSISFHVNKSSVPGAILKVELYETDPTQTLANSPPVWYQESEDYTLTPADIFDPISGDTTGSWITLMLKTPVIVDDSTTWLAAVHGTQGLVGDTSLISSSSNDNSVSYIQNNCASPATWGGISKPLLIRMNLTSNTTATVVEEHKAEGKIKVYPNPSSGKFVVAVPKLNNTDYNIQITNILGKIVFSKDLTVQGKFSEEIDLTDLANGVYLLQLSDNKTVITEKIVIE